MEPFKLDNVPRMKPGFKTPESYFDTFEERMMQRLNQPEPKVLPLYKRRPFWASTAAAVVVLAGSLTFYLNGSKPVQPDAAAIENYLVYQGGGISYDLVGSLDNNDIDALEASLAVSDDAAINYIDNENIYLNY